ncbi:unnamed protein product [Paramecium pentaurelia]|uniref:Uncharacterized protein n=1 Tax=Paramecium pentaurelia TaxID=43138 RepID=A0A8S1VRI2_9CILI|nr:unnamed protein product [Paramecium pentaurelia]
MNETQKISQMQIDDIHYFDFPGFDDNLSRYARLAHRISLYNYLKKTKKVIGFMVLDGSIRDAQIIKDTIDPIYLMMKDKNQLLLENENWLSLILVKVKQNTRVDYRVEIAPINNWAQAYKGLLDGRYSLYKTMYANDNQCVEFYKPQENLNNNSQAVEVITNSIKTKIINIIQSQLKTNNQQIEFELLVEPKLFYLSEMSTFLLNIKIQQILDLFTNQFNEYIQDETKSISVKKESISDLKFKIQEDVKTAEFQNQTNYFCLLIEDVQSCIQSLKLFQNNQIQPIKISTQNLRQNMEKIIEIIKLIENLIKGFYIATLIDSIIGAIASFGAALLGEEIIVALSAAALRKAIITISVRTAITATSGAAGSLLIGIVLDVLKNKILKYFYDKYLEEQNSKNDLNFILNKQNLYFIHILYLQLYLNLQVNKQFQTKILSYTQQIISKVLQYQRILELSAYFCQ